MRNLEKRQKDALDHYALHNDKDKAAAIAGYKNVRSFRALLLKENAISYLENIKRAASAAVQVDAEDLLRQLNNMRLANYSEIIDRETGLFLPVCDWPDHWQQMVQQIDVYEEFEGRGEDREHVGRVHRVKFMPRDKVLKMFGDHVGIKGFQQQQVHQHLHLHQSPERIAAARSRARALPNHTPTPTPHPRGSEDSAPLQGEEECSSLPGDFHVLSDDEFEKRRGRASAFAWRKKNSA